MSLTANEFKAWIAQSAERDTDPSVMEAIGTLANCPLDAEAIWINGGETLRESEVIRFRDIATKHGTIEPSELNWGVFTLSSMFTLVPHYIIPEV